MLNVTIGQLPKSSQLWDNPSPIFQQELRRIGRRFSRLQVNKYRERLIVIGAVLSLCFGVYFIWDTEFVYYRYNENRFTIIFALMVLTTFILTVVADGVYFLHPMRSISDEQTKGQWELIRITPITEHRIIADKHAIARIKARRAAMTEAMVRGVLMGSTSFFLVYRVLRNFGSSGGFQQTIVIGMMFMVYGVLAAVLLLEPFWRMMAFTSVGLWISARHRDMTMGVITAAGIWFGFRLTQMVTLIGGMYIAIRLINPLQERAQRAVYRYNDYQTNSNYVALSTSINFITIMLYIGIFTLILYLIYYAMHEHSINATEQSAFSSEDTQ